MTEIKTRSDSTVELVLQAGSDDFICKAARVSTLGAESFETSESVGLIRFLMKNRHGSPFEHGLMTFRITAPIFVWREFMRHRIGFSYNEESGRYKVLDPVFYVPPGNRPLLQEGKPGAYTFVMGTEFEQEITRNSLQSSYEFAWNEYKHQLDLGIAKEVARMCLPVGIFSTAYVSCNPRSIMSFLSLRTKYSESTFPSYPQWEIEQVAFKMQWLFRDHWPITFNEFNSNGRVSP